MTAQTILGIMIPFAGTSLGAAMVFILKKNISDGLQKILTGFAAGVMGVSAEKLTLDTACGSIPEWDSVMHLRLVMEAEAAYGVSFPLEMVPELRTLADFYRRIVASDRPSRSV